MVEQKQGIPTSRFDRFLDTVGDGSGTKDAALDASANDIVFTAAITDILTSVAHDRVTGDGPYYISNSGGGLPGGLVAATRYWFVKLTDDTFSFAISYANAIATVAVVVDVTSTGTGVQTLHLPTIFKIVPADGALYLVARLLVAIQDDGPPAASGGYGGEAALINGVELFHKRTGTGNGQIIADLTDGVPITMNSHFCRYAGVDVEALNWGTGDDTVSARLTFTKAGGPLELRGSRGDWLEVSINDDHSDLVAEYFMAQGVESGAIIL